MTSDDQTALIARLQAENAALNDQVKLLVQVEHRLSRSQSSLDRQLTRIKALNGLALACARNDCPEAVLVWTANLVAECFYVDQVVAATLGADQRTLVRIDGGGAVGLDPTLAAWLTALPCALLGPEPHVFALLDALGMPPPPPQGLVAILPLSHADGALAGVVVALATGAVTGFHLERLHETHRSFLELVTTHAEQALRAATLTTELRHSSATLAAANETIRDSMHQLAAAQKMEAIGRLAGGVAHDFNNLLTVILGNCELVLLELGAATPLYDDVAQIADAARQAAEITRQLLTFGRKQEQNRAEVDLNDVAMGMSRLLGRVIGEQVTLRLALDPQLPRVVVDRVQIEQALLNLVVNARDASLGRGAITVGTRVATPADLRRAGVEGAGAHVLLFVSDAGTGMDAETRARIFEPFFTTKRPGEGTGLGLAIVYGVSAQNDGHVVVDSEVGCGTTFSLLFPAVAGRSAPVPIRRDKLATVLVVDDERRILDFASRVLRDAGYDVLGVGSGDEALATVAGCAVDVVVSDVVMPGLSGVDVARILRTRRPELPVVLMSGHTFDALDPAELAGPGGFLPKPFTAADLRRHVGRALGAR